MFLVKRIILETKPNYLPKNMLLDVIGFTKSNITMIDQLSDVCMFTNTCGATRLYVLVYVDYVLAKLFVVFAKLK